MEEKEISADQKSTQSKSKTTSDTLYEIKGATAGPVSYRKLFRYAGWKEYVLMLFGTVGALMHSAGFPVVFLLLGNLATSLMSFGQSTNCRASLNASLQSNFSTMVNTSQSNIFEVRRNEFEHAVLDIIYTLVYTGLGVFVGAFLHTYCWTRQAISVSAKIRDQYFRSLISQDIGYHDIASAGELNSKLIEGIQKIEEGIGAKVGNFIVAVAQIVVLLIIAFYSSWKVTLVNLAATPLLAGSVSILYKILRSFGIKEATAYSEAGTIAEETISSIKTVVAFGCQEKELQRYSNHLGLAKKVAIKKESLKGSNPGIIRFVLFSMYGLSFWYGGKLVLEDEIVVGSFLTSFFCVMYGALSVAALGGAIAYFVAAKIGGGSVFEVIDRKPEIDILSNEGYKPDNFECDIEIRNVCFHYPTRPTVEVAKSVDIKVEPGRTVALVGQSGSGKSTIIQLLQRFYDIQSGSIKIGGHDIKSLNLNWLRLQIGVVSQEPILFATTIRENIRWGKQGATDKEVEEAAKQANASDFIMKLTDKYDTFVGDKGALLSGGQKQRIAIARAILRKPKILLLDEATSALDSQSEKIVQDALENASHDCTTIMVAHRLSTIRNVDRIYSFENGKVVETGSHQELMQIDDGVYKKLVKAQTSIEANDSLQIDITDHQKRFMDACGDERDEEHFAKIDFKLESKEKKDKKSSTEDAKEKEILFAEVLSYNKPETPYIIIGCIFSLLAGSTDPLLAIIFGNVLNVLSNCDSLSDKFADIRLLGLMFFVLGVSAGISYAIQSCMFAKSGMELVIRLRKAAFKAILRQDISYFDDPSHAAGALCTKLSTDAYKVQGATGIRIGSILKVISAMSVAVGIAFGYTWQLALVMVGLLPLVILSGFVQHWTSSGQAKPGQGDYEKAVNIATEAIYNIRTVASLSRETTILKEFEASLKAPKKKARRHALLSALAYAYAYTLPFIANATVFRLGVFLVINGFIPFYYIFIVMFAVVYAGRGIGETGIYVPDYAEAKKAASRVISLIKSLPTIDSFSNSGKKPAHCQGEISMQSIFFNYPSRPDDDIIQDLSLSIKSGETLAIVGASGSGKSTLIQLIERFYDVDGGKLLLDGVDVKDLNVSWLRQQIGVVSQEPILFDRSIRDNILYGDCSRVPDDSEVIRAATSANIHDFIDNLPEKYETRVGKQGNQLSGGQKQRIAIARALLRDPKVLLLDEATSALDAESEKIVQKTLDMASVGRSCIVIAHRLSTVKNAHEIAVVEDGRIREIGTHAELIALRGSYYELVNAQLVSNDGET